MRPNQIKARLIEQAGTIKAVAQAIGETLPVVSQTINEHRLNQRVRDKLTRQFGIRFSKFVSRQSARETAN